MSLQKLATQPLPMRDLCAAMDTDATRINNHGPAIQVGCPTQSPGAGLSACILVFVESSGAIAEFGAFSQNSLLRDKLNWIAPGSQLLAPTADLRLTDIGATIASLVSALETSAIEEALKRPSPKTQRARKTHGRSYFSKNWLRHGPPPTLSLAIYIVSDIYCPCDKR
jgi:hypothetical protein